jgi:hypothetical protein
MQNKTQEELDILHSGLMALEELLVKKGVITLGELNPLVKKCYDECKKNREEGKTLEIK